MDAFLAWQVQREASLLLKQTAFLQHLDEKLGSHSAKSVKGLLISSDSSDDTTWLSSIRDALESQELFDEVSAPTLDRSPRVHLSCLDVMMRHVWKCRCSQDRTSRAMLYSMQLDVCE